MGFEQQKLISLMSSPGRISDEEIAMLEELLQKYPYFQLGHSLLAKAKHDRQSPDAYQALSRAAISVPNRSLLRQLFYDNLCIESNGNSFTTTNEAWDSSDAEQHTHRCRKIKLLRMQNQTPCLRLSQMRCTMN